MLCVYVSVDQMELLQFACEFYIIFGVKFSSWITDNLIVASRM